MDKRKEIPADILDKDLIAAAKGLRPEFVRADALKTVLERNLDPRKALLHQTLRDKAAPRELRCIAAVSLGRDLSQETFLIKSLDQNEESTVLRRIVQSLGQIGSEKSLDALLKVRLPPGSRAEKNLKFARSLISYRHGLNRELLRPPAAADLLKFDQADAVSLDFQPVAREEIEHALPEIKQTMPGITITDKAASSFRCMNSKLWLLFNQEITGGQGAARVRGANAVLAVVMKFEHCPESWSVFEYILSQPNRHGKIDVTGVRPSGVINHFGQVQADGQEAEIVLETVNSVNALPMAFKAMYNIDGIALRVIEAISVPFRIETQLRPKAPAPG